MRLFKKDYVKYNDEDLMRFFIKGDQEAFVQIYDRYEGFMINFFYRKLWSDREKAEDFAHDLFAKLIDKPTAYDPNRSFKTWLFSVANNMCKNEYKKQEIRKPTGYDLPENAAVKDQGQLPDKEVDKNNFNAELATELAKLNEIHREVFMLRHYEGLSLLEIAETLGINEGTVKSRLHLATKTLAGKLAVFRNTMV